MAKKDLDNNSIGSFQIRRTIRIDAYPYRYLITHLNNVPKENAVDELVYLANLALLAGLNNSIPVSTTFGNNFSIKPSAVTNTSISKNPEPDNVDSEKVTMSRDAINRAFAKPSKK